MSGRVLVVQQWPRYRPSDEGACGNATANGIAEHNDRTLSDSRGGAPLGVIRQIFPSIFRSIDNNV